MGAWRVGCCGGGRLVRVSLGRLGGGAVPPGPCGPGADPARGGRCAGPAAPLAGALGSGCRRAPGAQQGCSLGTWVMGLGPGWSWGLGVLRPPTPPNRPPPSPAERVCLLPAFSPGLCGARGLAAGGACRPGTQPPGPSPCPAGCPHPGAAAAARSCIIHGSTEPLCWEGVGRGSRAGPARGLGRPRPAGRSGRRGRRPLCGVRRPGVGTECGRCVCSQQRPGRSPALGPSLGIWCSVWRHKRRERPEGCDGGQLGLRRVHLRLSSTCPHVQCPCGQTVGEQEDLKSFPLPAAR